MQCCAIVSLQHGTLVTRHTHTHTQAHTEKETERARQSESDSERERQTDRERQTGRQKQKERESQKGRGRNDRPWGDGDKRSDGQTCILSIIYIYTCRQTGRQKDRPTLRQRNSERVLDHLPIPSKVISSWVGPTPPEVITWLYFLENSATSLAISPKSSAMTDIWNI